MTMDWDRYAEIGRRAVEAGANVGSALGGAAQQGGEWFVDVNRQGVTLDEPPPQQQQQPASAPSTTTGRGRSGAAASGGFGDPTGSQNALMQLMVQEFGPELAPTMYGIAMAESGGNPHAENFDGEASIGLFQINTVPEANPHLAQKYDLYDPIQNIQAAKELLNTPQGLNHWTTYTGGHFLDYIDGAGGGGSFGTQQRGGWEEGNEISDADMASVAAREMLEMYLDPDADSLSRPEPGEVTDMFELAAGLRDLENGQVQTPEGIITSEMLNHPDPAVRAQYQSLYKDAEATLRNKWTETANRYELDQYDVRRQRAIDRDDTALAQYDAEASRWRDALARDEADISRAATEIERTLQGLQESRARAEFTTETQLEAAPYGTVGGKTAFTGSDLGAGATATMRQLGHQDPGNAIALNFPGSIQLDPQALMQQGDEALGVTGQIPGVPGLTVGAPPGAPSLRGTGHIALPETQRPVMPGSINLPSRGRREGDVPRGTLFR